MFVLKIDDVEIGDVKRFTETKQCLHHWIEIG